MPRLLGAKLRHLRQQRQQTQVELAQQIGLASHAHLNNLEASRRAASLDLIVRAADVLSTTTDYLLRDTLPVEDAPTTTHIPQQGELWPEQFRKTLVQLRQRAGLNQTDLARALGLASQAYISNLEAGRKQPSPELVVQIADMFGVTTDELLRGSREG